MAEQVDGGGIMKRIKILYNLGCFLLVSVGLFAAGSGMAGEYVALDGVKDVKVVFDVRGKNVKPIALQLDLIHKTYHDANIRAASESPEVAVVFGGGAVKLISDKRKGYNDEEKMLLDLINGKLAEMSKDGIRLEVCLFAASVHGVDPETIPAHINRIENGWISLVGYQQKGFSLVAVF